MGSEVRREPSFGLAVTRSRRRAEGELRHRAAGGFGDTARMVDPLDIAVVTRVFISYSHDSGEHRARVRRLADQLRYEGVDAWLDQYSEVPPPLNWPEWMHAQVSDARFVLAICTEPYRRRVEGREEDGRGRGARWEGAILTQSLYEHQSGDSVKFIPVVFHEEDHEHVPYFLRGTTHYVVEPDRAESLENLLRHLKNRPLVVPPPLEAPPAEPRLGFEDEDKIGDAERRSTGGSGAGVSMASDDWSTAEAMGLSPESESGQEADSAEQLVRRFSTSARLAPAEEPAAPSDPALLRLPEGLETLIRMFPSRTTANQQWSHALEIIAELGARSVIVEPRYVDADYRSEYASFYSGVFTPYPTTTTRLHFFADEHVDVPLTRSESAYLGCIVIRPVESARVGPSYISPPHRLAAGVSTVVPRGVQLFGTDLQVQAVPYIQVDRQFGVGCATAAAWMCHAVAHLRGWVEQAAVTNFLGEAPGLSGAVRARHRHGMTMEELQDALARNGLPSLTYQIDHLRQPIGLEAVPRSADRGERASAVLCRYLRSGIPVIVTDDHHALVVIGHRVGHDGNPATWILHDSESGPYVAVNADDVFSAPSPQHWHAICVPLPVGVYLSAEAAEAWAALFL